VDVSLLDTAVSMLSYLAAWTLNRDWQPARVARSAHQTLVPSGNFRTADGWIVILCAKEKFWLHLIRRMGLAQLEHEPRFASFADRLAHRDDLLPILEARFATKPTADWLAALRGHVPCAPVNSVREALGDEQVRARGMILEVDHPVFGRMRQVACPIKTDGTATAPAPGPRLGEHTDRLLGDLLGYGAGTIESLRARGVIA
jgi:crotonobetainyl-CoA:carnitine CoA-transferase CaiB-like acyl-CoA transferase